MKLIVAVCSKRDARMSSQHSTATKNVYATKVVYFLVITQ